MTRTDLRHIVILGLGIILGPLAGAAILFGFFRAVAWLLAN